MRGSEFQSTDLVPLGGKKKKKKKRSHHARKTELWYPSRVLFKISDDSLLSLLYGRSVRGTCGPFLILECVLLEKEGLSNGRS